MLVNPICVPIIVINLSLDPHNVFFLAIVIFIKVINALKFLLDASIFLAMLFLMRHSFLLPNFILMRELYFVLKLHFYLIPMHRLIMREN